MTEKEVYDKLRKCAKSLLLQHSTDEVLYTGGRKIQYLLHEFEGEGCIFFKVDSYGYVNFGETVKANDISVNLFLDKVDTGKIRIEFYPRILIHCP